MGNKPDINNLHSRALHYDTLLWTLTSIMIPAITGLLIYLSSKSNFNVCLACFGYYLTILTAYFATSFREARHKIEKILEKNYDNETKEAIKSRKFLQWPFFLSLFVCLGGFWINLLIRETMNTKNVLLLWIVFSFSVVGFGYFIYFYIIGKGSNSK